MCVVVREGGQRVLRFGDESGPRALDNSIRSLAMFPLTLTSPQQAIPSQRNIDAPQQSRPPAQQPGSVHVSTRNLSNSLAMEPG